jgi:hypothetical protein
MDDVPCWRCAGLLRDPDVTRKGELSLSEEDPERHFCLSCKTIDQIDGGQEKNAWLARLAS